MERRGLSHRTDFYDIWDRFVSHGDISHVPGHIRLSWQRCRDLNINPYAEGIKCPLIDEELLRKRIEAQGDLYQIIASHSKNLRRYFDILPISFSFNDRDGYILFIEGTDDMLTLLAKNGVRTGAKATEDNIGTTAPTIALAEKRFSVVDGEEHYMQALHSLSCIAVPIFDCEGNLLGCLDITTTSTNKEKLKELIPLMHYMANSIQLELALKKRFDKFELFHSYYCSTFDHSNSILILIDNQGAILDLNRNARQTFKVRPENIKRGDVKTILGEQFNMDLLQKGVSVKAINIERYSVEPVAIFDRSGREMAFLLRLTQREKIRKTPPFKTNMARYTFEDIIGEGPLIKDLIEKAKRVARTGSNILLEGETGTGKELLAHAIHNESQYHNGPFMAINCAAIPRELVESELFGYEKGAFTGALCEGHRGKLELANSGTIFLDEIDTMEIGLQNKVLRVIEERQVTRVGGRYPIPLDIRIIAASSLSLDNELREGRFIPALYYRLNIVRLRLPSLRERKEDIPILIEYFIDEMNRRFNASIKGLHPDVLKGLMDYSWPGNIRELKNSIECAFNLCKSDTITSNDLPDYLFVSIDTVNKHTIHEITRKAMMDALRDFGNVKDAARYLDIPVTTFYRRMKKFGISGWIAHDQR